MITCTNTMAKCKGPCKRSQHCWPTRRNIVGPNMLRAFAHHVVCCCDLLEVVGWSLKLVKLHPTTSNKSQQHTTWCANARNMLGSTMLRAFARALRTVLGDAHMRVLPVENRYWPAVKRVCLWAFQGLDFFECRFINPSLDISCVIFECQKVHKREPWVNHDVYV